MDEPDATRGEERIGDGGFGTARHISRCDDRGRSNLHDENPCTPKVVRKTRYAFIGRYPVYDVGGEKSWGSRQFWSSASQAASGTATTLPDFIPVPTAQPSLHHHHPINPSTARLPFSPFLIPVLVFQVTSNHLFRLIITCLEIPVRSLYPRG